MCFAVAWLPLIHMQQGDGATRTKTNTGTIAASEDPKVREGEELHPCLLTLLVLYGRNTGIML